MSRDGGFTLIEVVAALALSALLLGTVLLAVRSEIALSEGVRESGRKWATVRNLASNLQRQLVSAASPVGTGMLSFKGGEDSFTFITTASRSGATPQGRGLVEVTYRRGEEANLLYEERALPLVETAFPVTAEGRETVLSRVVERFSILYRDGEGKESSAWPPLEGEQPAGLPATVEVTFGVRGVPEPVTVVARINR